MDKDELTEYVSLMEELKEVKNALSIDNSQEALLLMLYKKVSALEDCIHFNFEKR